MRTRLIAIALVALLGCGSHDAPPTPAPSVVPEPTPPPPPAPLTRAGPLCTYHGICWARPGPQGNALHAVRALAADHVIAVGDRGTVLAWDGHQWSFEDTPTRERLLDLADAPTGELFAVGEHGTILQREGDAWSAMVSGVDATLHAIVAIAANDIVAIGDGLALHYDGSTWSHETLPIEVTTETSLVALSRHDATLYAIGVPHGVGTSIERLLLSRDASGWHLLTTVHADVGSLVALTDGSLVLSGASARHGDGTTFRERQFGSDRPLDAIWSTAVDDAWAGGYDGRLAHWDGHAWQHESLEQELDIDDIDGTSASDVWVVGEHGLVAHRDATAWTSISNGAPDRLEGVGGLAANDVWAVGESVSLRFDGHGWDVGTLDGVFEALGVTSGALYAVGDEGAISRYADGAWTSETSGTTTKLEGVWASDATHAMAVGGSEWASRDGSAWSVIADRRASTGIWGSAPNDVWAAGGDGLEHFDGTTWSAASGVDPAPVFAVWGTAADDVWAVGAAGLVLHFDGSAWSSAHADTEQDLLGVWGRGASDVWAVGRHGTIVHWDGDRWRWRDSGTDELLHAIWGTEDGDAWIVGHGGVVLRVVR